jgi:hypothetical protein
MSARKAVVERYIDGFRRMDHDQILSCVSGDAISRLETYQVNAS